MDTVKIQAKKGETNNKIAFLGDMHIGRIDSNITAFQEAVDFIRQNEMNWIGMGDYVEGRIPSHKFYEPYETTHMVQEQYEEWIDLIRPIKHLCRGMLIGNHEDSLIRSTTVNPVKSYCRENDIPYMGTLGKIIYEDYEQREYPPTTIYVTHGHGGGNKPGGKINKLVDWVVRRECDALVVGHFHQLGSWVETTEGTGLETRRYKTVGISGTFMDSMHPTAESYALRQLMSPVPLGFMTMEILPHMVNPIHMRPIFLR